jgi:hypothetical protein
MRSVTSWLQLTYNKLTASRSIDTLGRRRWLLFTLPLMSLFLMAAAIAYNDNFSEGVEARNIAGTVFVYCEFAQLI